MSKTKKHLSKNTVRGIVIFAIAAILLQTCAMIFMSEWGLGVITPYVLASKSKKVNTGDSEFSELFTLDSEVNGADIVILSIEPGVEDSYKIASDYMQFLCRLTDVSCAVTYVNNDDVKEISEALVTGEYRDYSLACAKHKEKKTFTSQYFRFLDYLYSQNNRLPPDRKLPIYGIEGFGDYTIYLRSLVTKLFANPNALNGDHVEIVNANSMESYVALIQKHKEAFYEVLGDEFRIYAETVDALVENDTEEIALRSLVSLAPAGEGTVFAVLPRELVRDGSEFMNGVNEAYGKVVVTDTYYFNCTALDGETTKAVSDGSFPGFVSGIRIVSAGEMENFRDYFAKVAGVKSADSLDGIIGDMGEGTFFIVSGSGPAKYTEDKNNEETGTVLEAPGA